MPDQMTSFTVGFVQNSAHRLTGSPADFDPLLDMIGTAPCVLIGEASHGTHEFYRIRAEITKRLIREKDFRAVAIEGDWPDAYRVNRYVQGRGQDADAAEALSSFERFPAWMWRNADVLDFVGWLRAYNDSLPEPTSKVGFYGLDLYSLHASMATVLAYLDKIDPEGAQRARTRYACFDRFGGDPQAYGYVTGMGLSPTCETQVITQLMELHKRAAEYARKDGWIATEDFFSAEQNARLVKNAEQYYRSMFRDNVTSWNLRDAHMAETFDTLAQHLERRAIPAKIVVWAHNSHLGDARATQMHQSGEWNLGQLIRERYGSRARLIGFSTYDGTVTAASNWDAPAECKRVRRARSDSYEGLFHQAGIPAFLLLLSQDPQVALALRGPMLERAIGVIYRPESELQSHYFAAQLSDQFDAILHFDHTRAVEPLESIALATDTEPVETFPSGV